MREAHRLEAARSRLSCRWQLRRRTQKSVHPFVTQLIAYPPYEGTSVFGIATSNVITTVLILGMILTAYVCRIAAEERMLTDQLGKEY